jgi:hypothetical protein
VQICTAIPLMFANLPTLLVPFLSGENIALCTCAKSKKIKTCA